MELVKQKAIIEMQDFCEFNESYGLMLLRHIERAGRTCYKSEDKNLNNNFEITKRFIEKIVKSGHHSVLEHTNITVRLITNRGTTHELVRHRLASYSQESTRYCNYGSNHVKFIIPHWITSDISEGLIYNNKHELDNDENKYTLNEFR